MTAELHLAEDALALHFFLSTLRACSTLLSRTRTCTRRSSSIEQLKGPMAKTPGPLARDMHNPDADGTRDARPGTPGWVYRLSLN